MNTMNGRNGCNRCGMNDNQRDCMMTRCKNENCSCHSDTLYGMPLGIGYVPWQRWSKLYDSSEALYHGTIFPELNLPFLGCIPKGWPNGRGGRA